MIKFSAMAVHVAANYVCIKTKQLENIEISNFTFVGSRPFLDFNMHLFPIHIAIIKTFGEN